MAAILIRPELYSSIYPPVDTNFNKTITDFYALPQGTQMLCSAKQGTSVIVDRQYYGFKTADTPVMELFLNGVDQNINIYSNRFEIPKDTIIYGYTVTETSINLWTDPTYIDHSKPVMYGRRGIRVNPYTDNIYDVTASNGTESNAFMHLFNYTPLTIQKFTIEGVTKVYLDKLFADGWNNPVMTPKFLVSSTVISTGTVEEEINKINTQVTLLSNQIKEINDTVSELVPNLTKLVSAEASKNYVSR